MAVITQVQLETFTKDALLRAAAALTPPLQFGAKPRLDELQDPSNWLAFTFSQVTAASKAVITPGNLGGQVDAIVGTAVRDVEARLSGQIQQVAGSVLKVVADLKDAADAAKRPADVSAAVRDAVAAAFKPLQDSLKAAPADVVSRVVAAAPRERRPIAQVFAMPEMEGDCEVWGVSEHYDPDYIFQPKQLKDALKALERGDNFWLWGERSTGKTQFAINLAARLGRPFFRVSFDANLERSEFIGADGMTTGSSVWRDGVVLTAYNTAGAICLLDEVTTGRPEYISALHALLEPKSRFTVSSTGKLYQRACGMCFIAADNTNGSGDQTGRYTGTRPQNSALVDRFSFIEKILFLSEATEVALLVKKGYEPVVAAAIINVFTRCRAAVGGELVEPPSLRCAIAFCSYFDKSDPASTWEKTVVNKAPEESHEALRQLFTAHWRI